MGGGGGFQIRIFVNPNIAHIAAESEIACNFVKHTKRAIEIKNTVLLLTGQQGKD